MNESYFNDLANQERVQIVLKDYDLEQVPYQIQELQSATKLTIIPDRGWKVYPPVSFFDVKQFSPPYRTLPDEITSLTKLKHLRVVDLDLNELPENFGKLENLETVDLSFNKLNVSTELSKLNLLPKLRQLNVVGNMVDTVELKNWKKGRQNLEIIFKLDKNAS